MSNEVLPGCNRVLNADCLASPWHCPTLTTVKVALGGVNLDVTAVKVALPGPKRGQPGTKVPGWI